ncbi:BZ3500_MvSof-1268-A1-R1_Chr2-1g04625 [Microbotryum saponariae]|uniref:BZ3500_MvSof-1268-A1-R1_Chr2-1g04625 protein n=1 Tax=Microbotryum saponariae TaxID=289078 RepID=A0A2X0KBG3_9BASI|nr:BZ3500_MvSof-1268-A1-R1_Chr2-1g04625 [Microbotryum saponariae]SCZ92145.1 BZ3501_MvSof-1269-A2-R1_Chr2-1g04281 [Microbotryum saponariae]
MPIASTTDREFDKSVGTGMVSPNQVHKTIVPEPQMLEKVSTHLGETTVNDAAETANKERHMTMWQAVKAYPYACGWSMLFSTAIVMEGFDLTMINSFFALPAFQRKFGVQLPDGSYVITPEWQTGLSNGVQVGSIFGLMVNGWACDRFGYKKTIAVSLVAITLFIFITFFAVSLPILLIGEILCGVPWGVFQSLTTAYAAEVCPAPLRPYLTTYVNLCWVIGQFISSGVLKGVSGMSEDNQWAYRIPFALQWVWPLPILAGALLAPESPWWLVRQGRLGDAANSLNRLGSISAEGFIDVDAKINQMIFTNEIEKEINAGTTYFDCFKGTNLRRTEIVCMVWMIQTLAGSGFIGYSTVFFERAGLSNSNAFSLSLGNYALGAVGTISSWWTMQWFGRRDLYMWGLLSMGVVLFAVGGAGFGSGSGASWAAGALIVFYSFLYQFTVGPVCYCLVAEISSTRLRAKSVVLARTAYNIVGIVNNIVFPRMLSPLSWNWNAKAGFFWGASCFLCTIWCYFRLPEPKGRTYLELDILFTDKVSARKFKTTAVDVRAHGRSNEKHYEPTGIVH